MKKKPVIANSLVFSYLAHRKTLGVLGIALPIVLSLGGWIVFQTGLQKTLSDYYYTGMRDVLVGSLWAIGIFLLSYKGYERSDALAGVMGGLIAVGVTLFPTTPPTNPSVAATWIGGIHLVLGTLFFGTLFYFSFFLFTRTDPKKRPTRRKLQRNVVYRACGIAIAASVLLSAVVLFLQSKGATPIDAFQPVLWLETIAIEAFGLSWLTKGEAILKDQG